MKVMQWFWFLWNNQNHEIKMMQNQWKWFNDFDFSEIIKSWDENDVQVMKVMLCSLDCREGHMKKLKWVCAVLVSRSKEQGQKNILKDILSNFFFFSKSLYLVETKVAGAENVWGRGSPPSKSCKKILLPPTVEG